MRHRYGQRLTTLKLPSTLNAVAFYQRAGFEGQARTEHELPDGTRLACVKMQKLLRRAD